MEPSSAPHGDAPFTRRACILFVEDELLIRMMASDELRNAGYDVIEALNADEAVAVLRSLPRVDMIVTDVRMPGSMDGIGLLRYVKDMFPKIPVILTSGHLQPTRARMEGAAQFIPKPYDLESFVKAVEAALAEKP